MGCKDADDLAQKVNYYQQYIFDGFIKFMLGYYLDSLLLAVLCCNSAKLIFSQVYNL